VFKNSYLRIPSVRYRTLKYIPVGKGATLTTSRWSPSDLEDFHSSVPNVSLRLAFAQKPLDSLL